VPDITSNIQTFTVFVIVDFIKMCSYVQLSMSKMKPFT